MIKQGSLNVNTRFVRASTLIQSFWQVISFDARTFSLALDWAKRKVRGTEAVKSKNRNSSQLQLIITRGDLKYLQADYSTPIHLACCQGNLDITKMLVKRGAKIECEDGNGLTPLLRWLKIIICSFSRLISELVFSGTGWNSDHTAPWFDMVRCWLHHGTGFKSMSTSLKCFSCFLLLFVSLFEEKKGGWCLVFKLKTKLTYGGRTVIEFELVTDNFISRSLFQI